MISTELKSLKRYKNQKGEFHKETWSLNAKRYDPEFLVGLQDRFAEHNKSGSCSRCSRLDAKACADEEVLRAIDLAMQTDYKTKIDRLIDSVEISLGERLSINVVRQKIRELLTPYIDFFAKQQKTANALARLDFHRLQNEIVAERKKLKSGLEEVDQRREIYKEAINGRFLDLKANQVLMEQNKLLARELARMKQRYEPQAPSSKPSHPPLLEGHPN